MGVVVVGLHKQVERHNQLFVHCIPKSAVALVLDFTGSQQLQEEYWIQAPFDNLDQGFGYLLVHLDPLLKQPCGNPVVGIGRWLSAWQVRSEFGKAPEALNLPAQEDF